MAALATEAANLAWQRVKIRLSYLEASADVQDRFRVLKQHLAQEGGNKNLQVITFTDANLTTNVNSLDGALTFYALYVKKVGTISAAGAFAGTATDAWVKLYDDATDDSTTGDARFSLPLLVANDEATFMSAAGLPVVDGIVLVAHTTSNGTTDSTAGDAGAGFIIVGS